MTGIESPGRCESASASVCTFPSLPFVALFHVLPSGLLLPTFCKISCRVPQAALTCHLPVLCSGPSPITVKVLSSGRRLVSMAPVRRLPSLSCFSAISHALPTHGGRHLLFCKVRIYLSLNPGLTCSAASRSCLQRLLAVLALNTICRTLGST